MSKEKEAKPGYKMPRPAIGETVIVFRDGNEKDPLPALVTKLGEVTISATALYPDDYSVHPFPSIRHVSDPSLSKPDVRANGTWDFGPTTKALADLAQQVREMAQFVDELAGGKKA